jgi:hypothetical protein
VTEVFFFVEAQMLPALYEVNGQNLHCCLCSSLVVALHTRRYFEPMQKVKVEVEN